MKVIRDIFRSWAKLFLMCVLIGALLMALAELLMPTPPSCYITVMASSDPVPGCEQLYSEMAQASESEGNSNLINSMVERFASRTASDSSFSEN